MAVPAILASLSFVLLTSTTTARADPFPYDPGFNIQAVAATAKALPSHSWEYGTATEALLELYNPSYSVFSSSAFPVPVLNKNDVPALAYAASNIVLGAGQNGLSNGDGAVGDPASLGVGAVLLGKTDSSYANGASQEMGFITGQAPRFWNGAISQRADVAELWADFVYMAPPFLAYYAVDNSNSSLLQLAVNQCGLYRQVLQANLSTSTPWKGVWEHIIGPQSADPGLWGTGNAWASAGMARVLATVMNAPASLTSAFKTQAVNNLTGWIKEILDGAIGAPLNGGLLRNYLDDTSNDGHGFQDISGSSLIAAVAYRMAVLQPSSFGSKYIQWADGIRTTLGSNDANGNPHVTSNGIVTPAVNPLGWTDTTPYTAGSPEGNNFVVLMYAAWRDCIIAGVCAAPAPNACGTALNLQRGARNGVFDQGCANLVDNCRFAVAAANTGNIWGIQSCVAAATCQGSSTLISIVQCTSGGTNVPAASQALNLDYNIYATIVGNCAWQSGGCPITQQNYIDFVYGTLSQINTNSWPDVNNVINNWWTSIMQWTATGATIPYTNFNDWLHWSNT